MEKLLIIANCSTYHTAPRGIQANRLINELAKYYKVFLLTSKWSIPDNNNYFVNDLEKIVIVSDFIRFSAKVYRRIWNFLSFRDDIWYFKSQKILYKLIAEENIKNVLTLSMHLSSAELGLAVKNKFNLNKLMTFLSDPISINEYLYNYQWQKSLLKRYEKKIFFNSDNIILPSKIMKDAYYRLYPQFKNKFHYIPHSFTSIEKENRDRKSYNKKIIRYIGSLNKKRNPQKLIEFIINNKEFFTNRKVSFEFYGRISIELKKMIHFNSNDIIKYCGYVPYFEVTNLVKTSYALLLIDANIPGSPFLPSKLIEYLPYKIPIIGITPEDSESSRVLKETGNFNISEDNIEELLNLVEKLEKEDIFINDSIDFYNIKNVGSMWISLINKQH